MTDTGLVLEGGGMRGIYTAGVLDLFMDKNIKFPYVIGVSAGACHGVSYVSWQKGRSKKVNTEYIQDPKYLSFRNLIKERNIFGMDYVFNEIPTKLVPFDFETFFDSDMKFVSVATNCETGEPVYFYKNKNNSLMKELMASSSLPFLSQMIEIQGEKYLDGGLVDPIPIKKSIEDGYKKNIIVLTRNKGYRKKPFRGNFAARRFYSKYPALVQSLNSRFKLYNDTMDYIEDLESKGEVLVIQPKGQIKVDRLEKNPAKLIDFYEQGYKETEVILDKIKDFIDY